MNIVAILLMVVALAISISLHEMMHSFVAYKLGDSTAQRNGRISLNPLAHIDPITTIALPIGLMIMGFPPFAAAKPVPVNNMVLKGGTFGMALVGIAGPLTNLVLAIVFGAISQLIPDQSGLIYAFLISFVSINVSLFVFNMIPWPPLDGSRVLYAIAPDPIRSLMNSIESMGFSSIIIFMMLIFPLLNSYFETAYTFLVNLLT